jgi:hypothetical protein
VSCTLANASPLVEKKPQSIIGRALPFFKSVVLVLLPRMKCVHEGGEVVGEVVGDWEGEVVGNVVGEVVDDAVGDVVRLVVGELVVGDVVWDTVGD